MKESHKGIEFKVERLKDSTKEKGGFCFELGSTKIIKRWNTKVDKESKEFKNNEIFETDFLAALSFIDAVNEVIETSNPFIIGNILNQIWFGRF